MDQILLCDQISVPLELFWWQGLVVLVPELIRTKHAALCLQLHIKCSTRVKVMVIKESCWKSACAVWIILLAMLCLSVSHFDISPFHHMENMSCVLFAYKWNPLVSEHGPYRTSLRLYGLICHWSRTKPSLLSSFLVAGTPTPAKALTRTWPKPMEASLHRQDPGIAPCMRSSCPTRMVLVQRMQGQEAGSWPHGPTYPYLTTSQTRPGYKRSLTGETFGMTFLK